MDLLGDTVAQSHPTAFDRDDRGALAKELSGLLLDGERRDRLGKAGHQRYRDTFTSRHYAHRLQSLLLDHALLAEGGQIDNPAEYVARMNRLLLELDSAPGAK